MRIEPGIEFCICTYNRLNYLKNCAETLLSQLVPGTSSLTIVDNNSNDGTATWCKDLVKTHPGLQYIHELNQGLSHARNTGWRQARHEWIFYLDDDCIPASDLVKAAIQIVQSPQVWSAVGGRIYAFTDANAILAPEQAEKLFVLPFRETVILEKEYIRGPCMMFKKKVLEDIGGFDITLGMIGNQMRYGEEIELQNRLRKAGHSIAYAPALVVYHSIRDEKKSIRWILSSEYARRRDKRTFEPLPISTAFLSLVQTSIGRVFWTPVYLGRLLFDKDYQFKDALLDTCKPWMFRWGDLVGSIHHGKRDQNKK